MRRYEPLLYALAAALLSFAVVAIGLKDTAPVHFANSIWQDIRISAASPALPASDQIVVVTISEATLGEFVYRSPVDRGFVAQTIDQILQKGASKIVIDLLFDQATEPQKDDRLRQTLMDGGDRIVVVAPQQRDQALFFRPSEHLTLALPNLVKDAYDGTVRWIYPGRDGLPGIATAAIDIRLPQQDDGTDLIYPSREDDLYNLFPTFEAQTVAALPAAWFEGKVVFLGAALDASDRHRTPYSTLFGVDTLVPGVFLHALAAHQIKMGLSVREFLEEQIWGMIIIAAIAGAALSLWHQRPSIKGIAGLALVMVIVGFDFSLWQSSYTTLPTIPILLALFMGFIFASTTLHWIFREKKNFLKHAFSHYAPESIVQELMIHPEKLRLGGEKREVTFLFTDLQGFTAMSEAVPSEALVPLLNAYMDGIIEPILANGGTIDRMMGDAVIAIFNAPLDLPGHRCAAVQAALDIDAFCQAFQLKQRDNGIPFGRTRIGVNTGQATVGNFGGHHRFQYTAHGDCVNTAARLETLNKHTGTTILIGEETAQECDKVSLRPVARFVLVGKEQPIGVYEPMEISEQYKAYHLAYEALSKGKSETAFSAYLEEWPNDPVAQFHASRIASGETGDLVHMDKK